MRTVLLLLFFLISSVPIASAQTGTLTGRVLDSLNQPIENVSVIAGKTGTVTKENGEYSIRIEAGKKVTVLFSHITYTPFQKAFTLQKGKTVHFSPKLYQRSEEMREVILEDRGKVSEGIISLDTETARVMPAANPGIESVLKTLPGVSFNNELSTQYNVRGGSFEENLVYVNGIEVYRPFLIRSGQQEGLSFVNTELTQNVDFSAGGFQAKYGDKLSSVLDITYRKPERFGVGVQASLLGASATVEGVSKNDKWKAMVGARYRNNNLFFNSSDTEGDFRPSFTDVQAFVSYAWSSKFSMEFLGSYSLNNYEVYPTSRRTNFGSLADPQSLVVQYEGREEDRYQTLFGALKGNLEVNEDLHLALTLSSYYTTEQEYYDIQASYGIGDVNSDFASADFGEVGFVQAIGRQLDHARNDLKARINSAQLSGTWRQSHNLIEFGVKYQLEDIQDRIVEWQVIDSAGFSLRPPHLLPNNEQPYEPFTGPIVPYAGVRAINDVTVARVSGFVQWSKRSSLGDHEVWYNAGIRAQHWTIDGDGISEEAHTVVSPRGQFAIKPDWDRDMLFRISGGLYYQPPFYRELRDSLGLVHPEVKAQRSIHLVVGNDYSFKLWGRPFKLLSEIYYKKLDDVNPFTIDNVRIRYRARNNAVAYAVGADLRLHGEFVPGTESWFSVGYLLTEENIEDRGYISRPTDQRLKFALLFQDYVPSVPELKMYLNLVYNTGVPGGSPSYADPYLYQNRLPAYFRSDLGISYVFVDSKNPPSARWQEVFRELSAGIELFNMFDNRNTITNTWVKDISSQLYVGVPNYLTGRVLNVKLSMRL